MGVHVYGMPCDVDKITEIANKHGLKVIYDAAHAFMTEINGVPIARFGDITMFSFHATKLFHTFEGGCLAYGNHSLGEELNLLKNFGISNEESVLLPGINAKLSEIQCAMGIEMLREAKFERERRRSLRIKYFELLSKIEGIDCFVLPETVSDSLQYMVIRVDKDKFGLSRDQLHEGLKLFNVFARKYFYPLCSEYAFYKNAVSDGNENAKLAASQVMCLPFYGELGEAAVEKIVEIIQHLGNTRKLN